MGENLYIFSKKSSQKSNFWASYIIITCVEASQGSVNSNHDPQG